MTRILIGDNVIIAVGVDLVSLARFAAAVQRRPALVSRLFTAREAHTDTGAARTNASLAARFAAKEAVAKALGAPAGLAWHDCEILAEESGRPTVHTRGSVSQAARARGIERWHLSLTHDGDYAIAQVVAEGSALESGA